ncbi:MAG: VWA domain-containing protein [Porticoccaceae bacterium]
MPEELLELLGRFQWLRPWWLLAIPPAAGLAALLHRRHASAGDWERVIAPALLPWLLEQDAAAPRQRLPWLALAAWIIAALALAGPSWRDLPQPVYRSEQPLAILFDLSPSMLAQDLKPDRLTRARLKLLDLLAARQEGATALVAYAGDAHVVTPLSDDARTLAALAPALTPDLLPTPGSAPEIALAKALELLANVGDQQGDILLITDGISPEAAAAMTSRLAGAENVRLSILAAGTPAGAPAPLPGGRFVRDGSGNLLIARLDPAPLQALARRHGGRYVELGADDRDVRMLTESFTAQARARTTVLQQHRDARRDEGPWLALLLLPFAVFAWRRGLFAMLLLAPLLTGTPSARALEWQDLWLWPDQRGQRALDAGDAATAQQEFRDPARRGTAAYRAGDLGTAATEFGKIDAANAHYNRGNTLARSGDYPGAIAAYDRALELDPDLADASYNRELVQRVQQQQQQEQQQEQEQEQEQEQQSQQDERKQHNGEDAQSGAGAGDRQPPADTGDEGARGQSPSPPTDGADSPEQPAADKAPTGTPSASEAAATEPQNGHDADKPDADGMAGDDEHANPAGEKPDAETATAGVKPSESSAAGTPTPEEAQIQEQQLRALPDDPGGLLRRKFHYEAEQREERGERPAATGERW